MAGGCIISTLLLGAIMEVVLSTGKSAYTAISIYMSTIHRTAPEHDAQNADIPGQ